MSDPSVRETRVISGDGSYASFSDAERLASGVSWGAILAGAAGAAALSLILLILGVGLGLSSVSPWAQAGVTAGAFGVSTILWISFTQLAASGIGGYLAGRLRKQWSGVHTDEVYFRDTAHGFLAWCIATLTTAVLLTGTIASVISGGAQVGASLVGGAAATAAVAGVASASGTEGPIAPTRDQALPYAIDTLFRPNMTLQAPVAETTTSAPSAGSTEINSISPQAGPSPTSNAFSMRSVPEVSRIFAHRLATDAALPREDLNYVGQLVAQRTGMNQQDAEKRVTEAYGKLQAQAKEAKASAQEATDQARKASAYAALWLYVSLLLGAFVASLMATFGGRQRDL